VNWIDFVLLATLIVGALYGMKMGLIKAVFVTAGVYIGWLLAGQWSDKVGGIFEGSVSNDTVVTVLTYAVTMVAALIAANFAVKILKPMLTVFTLGLSSMVDKLGGLVLGLLLGVALSSALIIGFARLTYNLDISSVTDGVPEQASGRVVEIGEEQLAKVESVRESLETTLTESQLVPNYIKVFDAIPANAMGLIPSDFKVALKVLKTEIE
jgi:uncharacterized membrane protein required for colicin V production